MRCVKGRLCPLITIRRADATHFEWRMTSEDLRVNNAKVEQMSPAETERVHVDTNVTVIFNDGVH